MTDYDIHSCGYYCNRPACIEAQRNELRDKLFSDQAVKTYSGGKPNYTQPIEPANTRILVSHDWRDIWEQFDEHSFDIDEEFQKEMVAKHGEGYYYISPDEDWKRQKALIQNLIEAKLKEKNA
jgi:hypothetical protein